MLWILLLFPILSKKQQITSFNSMLWIHIDYPSQVGSPHGLYLTFNSMLWIQDSFRGLQGCFDSSVKLSTPCYGFWLEYTTHLPTTYMNRSFNSMLWIPWCSAPEPILLSKWSFNSMLWILARRARRIAPWRLARLSTPCYGFTEKF